jgi:hypothetical protein
MNKHKRALINLLMVIIPCLYLGVIPSYIVKYGMNNNIPAFNNGAPFHEVYSVFAAVWIFGHLIVWALLFALYMLCYGCQVRWLWLL